MENDTDERSELVELTAGIVSAYVANNTVVTTDLAGLISDGRPIAAAFLSLKI
jgi:predicted transcriptional regulator